MLHKSKSCINNHLSPQIRMVTDVSCMYYFEYLQRVEIWMLMKDKHCIIYVLGNLQS